MVDVKSQQVEGVVFGSENRFVSQDAKKKARNLKSLPGNEVSNWIRRIKIAFSCLALHYAKERRDMTAEELLACYLEH